MNLPAAVTDNAAAAVTGNAAAAGEPANLRGWQKLQHKAYNGSSNDIICLYVVQASMDMDMHMHMRC
jgi:hypothetical protein